MLTYKIGKQSPLQFKILILICKIFYMFNTMKLLPDLILQGKLSTWIECFVMILGSEQDASSPLAQKTEDLKTIEGLDKEEWWKLKGICSKISVKLFNK